MRRVALALLALLPLATALCPAVARANGRIPGATGLAFNPRDEQQLLLGLTYGLASSRDGGVSWSWMCEALFEGNGGDVDPSMVVTGDGTLVVLSLTNGGVLVSADDGCTFERAEGPLQGHRGVDLTLDPSEAGHIFALMSTIVEVTDARFPRYRNLLAHSRDHGRSWQVLHRFAEDMAPETVEVAPSDPRRVYVSGTATMDPLLGIVERSDDGGRTWTRTTVTLPRGSGSLYLSGIHPSDPDRLWFRVPGRGDIYGVLPTRLWQSADGAATFEPVADTHAGMLGFAVSPDGRKIAFGGPMDGLFIAPADGSAPPVHVSDRRITCLRWRAHGLHACTTDPSDADALAVAVDPAGDWTPLFRKADTCRMACGPVVDGPSVCQEAWQAIAPVVGAESLVCAPVAGASDAGLDAGPTRPPDAAPRRLPQADAAVHITTGKANGGGCAVATVSYEAPTWWLCAVALAIVSARLGGRRARPAR